MANFAQPDREGFFCAQWRIKAPGTADEFDAPVDNNWEVVEVWLNGGSEEDDDYYLVFVGGVERPQPIQNFFWGRELMEVKRPLNINQNHYPPLK